MFKRTFGALILAAVLGFSLAYADDDLGKKGNRGGGAKDNGGGQHDNGGRKDNGGDSGRRDNGGGQRDNGGGQRDNGGGQRDNGGGQRDNGGGRRDNGGGQRDNGGGRRDNGGGNNDNRDLGRKDDNLGRHDNGSGSGQRDNGGKKDNNGGSGKSDGGGRKDNGSGNSDNRDLGGRRDSGNGNTDNRDLGGRRGGSGSGSSGSIGRGNRGSGSDSPPIVIGGRDSDGSLGRGAPVRRGSGTYSSGDEIFGKKSGQSRSGNSSYGTRSNVNKGDRSNNSSFKPDSFRSNIPSRISREANRENRVQRGDSFRRGYYHYTRTWCDDWFWYSFYRFDYDDRCVVSPWYYYPHLPGYLINIRVDLGNWGFDFHSNDIYSWRQPIRDRWDWDWRSDRYNDLDYAIDDIVSAFNRGSIREMDKLITKRGRIYVEMDGGWRYSMNSDDFYDMMRDLVESTDTTSYRIVQVRTGRNQAMVVAEHEFTDPWGRRDHVYHKYGLEQDRWGYAITYFSSSTRRW